MIEFHAHSANEDQICHGLVDHLAAVAKIAGEFCEPFDSHDAGYYAGLWHDVGMFNPEFQRYLVGELGGRRGPDHKGAGAKLATNHLEPLALLVQGHHGGLQAMSLCKGWLNEKNTNPATQAAIDSARQAIPRLEPSTRLTPPAWISKGSSDTQKRLHVEMWLRMVFSGLVDADFLDTEAHFKSQQAVLRRTEIHIADLWQRFVSVHRERIQADAATGIVNKMRSEVYEACLAAAEKPPGIFRLAVPTGGGKTLSVGLFK